MILPSKELLSEVLKVEITYLTDELDENMLPYQVASQEGWSKINIYEIAHLCKEWAYDKGYIINTALEPLTHKVSWQYDLFKLRYEKIDMVMDIPPTQHFIITKAYDTEPEAVFKACERILKGEK